MSNIPLARGVLSHLADDLDERGLNADANVVRFAVAQMRRARPVRPRAAPTSAPVDEHTAAEIRRFAHSVGLSMSLQDIAEHFGTNQGRVSEALHGRR